jgi:hypothetical protein
MASLGQNHVLTVDFIQSRSVLQNRPGEIGLRVTAINTEPRLPRMDVLSRNRLNEMKS